MTLLVEPLVVVIEIVRTGLWVLITVELSLESVEGSIGVWTLVANDFVFFLNFLPSSDILDDRNSEFIGFLRLLDIFLDLRFLSHLLIVATRLKSAFHGLVKK
jgi:hypothetical protein